MNAADYETYQSPYTWRYGSEAMRRIWSEAQKRRLWRRLWLALAETQAEYGLVDSDQVEDLRRHSDDIDIRRALEIEAEIHHDLMAELKTFAEQAPAGGRILHLGATSMDIEDNAEALRVRQSLDLILDGLRSLLLEFAQQIERWSDTVVIAFTHLQPAEPTTLGYRLATYAQDLLEDLRRLAAARLELRGKGFKGAVGTSAAYAELIGADALPAFEQRLSERLGLPFYPVATQVYPRKQDYWITAALAGLGASLYRFGFDLRLMQSPPIGEWSEPFSARQVGSSAMPFKRNPITAEKIDSLARLLAQAPRTAWDNAAHSLLERTLDDSANRRTLLPEAFLAADELLRSAHRLIHGLQVSPESMHRNLAAYGPFAALERVLMELSKRGADRQEMHEVLRRHAISAWNALQSGAENPLGAYICSDPRLLQFIHAERLRQLLDAGAHIGDAPLRAQALAAAVRQELEA